MIIGAIELLATGMIFLSLLILLDGINTLDIFGILNLPPAELAVIGLLFEVVRYGVVFVVPLVTRSFAKFKPVITVINIICIALGAVVVLLAAFGVLNAVYFLLAVTFALWRTFTLTAYREAAAEESDACAGTVPRSGYFRCGDIPTGKDELTYKLIAMILSFVGVIYTEYIFIHDYLGQLTLITSITDTWVDTLYACLIVFCVIIGISWLVLFIVFPFVFHCFSDFKNIITVLLSLGIAANLISLSLYVFSATYVFFDGAIFIVSSPATLAVNLFGIMWNAALIFVYRSAADNENCVVQPIRCV